MDLISRIMVSLMPIVPRWLVWRVASRYIAGRKLEDAARVVAELNKQGIWATIDLLGEECTEESEARKAAKIYHHILERISQEGLLSNISLKPTHFGLRISYDLCYGLIEEVVSHSQEMGNFVRLDMEDHSCTDQTLKLYYDLRKRYDRVGVVIQSYLRRSLRDVHGLKEVKANVRLCKGIYNEPRRIAFKNRNIIIRNFALLLEELLSAGCYVGIATHCEETIWHAERIIHQLKLTPDQYEFQMLLGVEPELRSILVEKGHHLRVYVPFGTDWFPYSTRRLKENPRMAYYVMRTFFGLKSIQEK